MDAFRETTRQNLKGIIEIFRATSVAANTSTATTTPNHHPPSRAYDALLRLAAPSQFEPNPIDHFAYASDCLGSRPIRLSINSSIRLPQPPRAAHHARVTDSQGAHTPGMGNRRANT